ncbi:MAG: dockerin type I domain-containing protein [Oscillospiraceae bacterium]
MKKLIAFSAALAMMYSMPAFAVYSETAEDTVTSAEDTSAEEGGEEENDTTVWHVNFNEPAEAEMTDDTEGREYSVHIINPGGEARGGTDKWDVQFRIRGISIEEGHDYRITYRISSDTEGSYYTKIGNLDSSTVGEAVAGEVWHNQFGISTIKSYTEGTVHQDAETSYGSAWNNQKIGMGDTLNVTCDFKGIATIPEAEWSFFLGGAGATSATDCFAPGATVRFSNLTLTDLTTGETLVSGYAFNQSDVKGDINCDGKADVTDLSVMCLAKIGDIVLDDGQISSCDVDGSGKFDMADLAHFKSYLSGVRKEL